MSMVQCLCYGMGGEQRDDMGHECIYHAVIPAHPVGFVQLSPKGFVAVEKVN